MPLPVPRAGQVLPYWFLWKSEHEAGEESGRKLRPCVVVVAVVRADGTTRVAVVPVTHSPPAASRAAVELPLAVKRQLGLDSAPSWIICDELNEFDWPGVDLARQPPARDISGFCRKVSWKRCVRRFGKPDAGAD